MEPESDRQRLADQMAEFKNKAEKAYDDMYEAHGRDIDTCYRDAKDYYYEAIMLADELGMKQEADAMTERLLHIKAVYRSQFAG